MAFKKSFFNEIIGIALVLSALLSTASAVDCHGKSFHCVNSTHFIICVDLGGGVSQSIDNFLIPCPAPTVCLGTNQFECEFPAPTTPATTLNVISETTQPWEEVVVTTNSPQRKTTKEYSEKYLNTESLSLADSFITDTTVDYTTEVPLSAAPIDLNNINVKESVSIVPEASVYETATNVDTVTEPVLIYDTTANLDAGNFTAEVITEIPRTIPENIATGAIEVTKEIPLIDISTVDSFTNNSSDKPQIIPENITTGAREAITEIPPVDISTVEAFISNASGIPQIIPDNITTGAGEAITEIPLVDISTVEAFISNASGIPQIIPDNITTGAGEAITEIPLVDISTVEAIISNSSDIHQIIPENITTGAGEAITEIPLVDISTVKAIISNASDIPQIIPENITSGVGEAITETSLVDISTVDAIISNASDMPQIIPDNITTGAREAITEIPLVDISTVEAIISNSSDIHQIIPENITTGAGKAITEIPLVDISTVKAIISNASGIPQIIPDNITTGAGEAITEIPLVDISTVEAIISNSSDIHQIIPENITTGAGEAITEIPLVDISTVKAIISNASDIPQIIPENITSGVGEAITETSLVDISTVDAIISNASDMPQIIPDNITTGAGEAITEISLVDISTVEVTTEIPLIDISTVDSFTSNSSDKPQIIPDNITTGAREAITEIPLVDISTVEAFITNASDIHQLIPENITTGAEEAITEIPHGNISTVEAIIGNASDIPQIILENITTGAGEAITEIPLVDTSTVEAIIGNASDIPQIIPENITTGAGEAITETAFVDISTVEAIISNASDMPQIIPENITTVAGEVITEIPLIDISTVKAFISNASDILQIIPDNITTGAGEAITEIPLVDTSTVEAIISNASDIPQIISENITTGAGDTITEIPLVDISTIEAIISNASDIPQIIPENITTGAGKAITEIPLVDISTVKAIISNASDIPQIIPENITSGVGEAITETSLVDISTVDAIIGNASDMPQIIPDNITTGAGEAITEISLVDTSTVEAIISNASDMPHIITDNITTGAGEKITEIPHGDISTVDSFTSNSSDKPQIIPQNITTGAREAITEIPLVDISTVEAFITNASDIHQIIPENITTGAEEAITEIPHGNKSTVEAIIGNASDIPQIILENITTGAGEAITEIPLVDTSTVEAIISNASDIPQIIPENITTGAGEAITETPFVDISTVETIISNASDMPQIIPENITTAAGEAITEIPLVDISTVDINNIILETTPSTIIANDSSSNINVNLKPVPENTTNINITSNATANVKDYAETTLSTLNTDTIISTEQVVTTTTEKSYTTEVNSLTNNHLDSTGDLVQNGATFEQTTSDYLTFDMESLYTNPPSTIGPEEILTTDTTVNLITEVPALNEENLLNRLPTNIKTVVTQDSVTINSVAIENPTLHINQEVQTQTDDIYTTERSLIVTKTDQVPSISTDDNLQFTTETTLSMNKTGIVTDDNTSSLPVEKTISSLQNKTRTETNEVIKNQAERMSTTESGLFKDNTETTETKSTIADEPTGKNKTESNILANTIFDSVISKAELSTEKSTPAISDLQTVANEMTAETPPVSVSNDQIQQFTGNAALGTEKTTLITEIKVIMDKSTRNITTKFPQDQEASNIETGLAKTEQSNLNTSENAVTTENSVYVDTSILTTIKGFDEKLQTLNVTEQPITVTYDEKLQTVANDNVKTERPIFSTTNELLKLKDEKALGKEKPKFIKNDNFEKDVNNNFTFEDSKVIIINDTKETIIQKSQDGVRSTTETEYVKDVILKIQPEIMVVTTDSTTNADIIESDSFTTNTNSLLTGITIMDKPDINNNNLIPTIQDVIVTTDAVTEEVNQDKLSLSYDSETTMATTVDILIPEIVKTNSPNWGDTITTYNPLEETEKPVSIIFDINAIQSDLNKEQATEKVFEGSVTTNTPTVTNLDYTTTDRDLIQKNLLLDTVNSGFGSTNQNEQETIGSNINVKKTTLINEKETKSGIRSETTTEDNQISTNDNIEVQKNTNASLGTTENINVMVITSSDTLGAPHENDVKQIEIAIDGTNATGQSSLDTETDSSIPNIPVTETNIISQTNQNGDVSIDQFGTNIITGAVDYTTVAVDNFSNTDNSVTESTNLSVKSDLGKLGNDIIPQQSQTTSESIDKVKSNLLETIEGSTSSNQIVFDSQADTINKLNQDSRQTNVAATENLQVNTIINKLNQDSEQTNVAGTLVTNVLNDDNTSTTESNKGQTSIKANSGFEIIENNIINEQKDNGFNVINSIEGSANPNQIISDSQANTIINKSNQDAEQTNDAATLITIASNDNMTTTESSNGPTITKAYPQSINDKTSKDIIITAASINENSNLADDIHPSTIASTTKTVNNSIDNFDVPSSSVPVRNNDTKYTVIENALQAIGDFFNTASKNSTRGTNNINNEAQTKKNIHVSEVMTEANTATESETVLDSTVFNNLQVSKASEMVPKLDGNIKLGSTQSALVSKGQNIENKNINKPVAHIVPFDELIGLTNRVEDKVTANVEVSKSIMSGISPEMVMKPALDILSTKTNEIGSDGKAIDNEGDLLSTYNSKVNKIEITTESYKPVSSNSATIISSTTSMPNNLLQNLPLPRVVPEAENIPIVNTKELGISSTSEKTDTNGVRPDIGPVFVNINTNLNENVVPENIHQIIVPSNKQSDLSGQQNAPVSTVEKEIKQHFTNTNATISSGISAVKATRPQNNTQKITSTGTVLPRNNSSAAPKNTSLSETNNIVSIISNNIIGNEQKAINLQQNNSVNITEQSKSQVTSTNKPVQKANSSLTSATQASTKKPASKSVSIVTENPMKQVVNNTLNYSCINGVRGRYSDKDDCRKFYICMGNTAPIIGHCPVNTVFSDIKKLCTKNMSHCIRQNEFKCPSDGRFTDVIKDTVYYICVNHKNHLYRFKFQCQKGFTLNKTTVRCVENKEVESNESVSISSDNDSESSDITSSTSTNSISTSSTSRSSGSSSSNTDSESNSSKSKQKKEKSEDKDDDDDEVFECEKQGKFPVRNDCKRYYLCKKNRKGQYRRKLKKCDSGDVFHKSKKKCVDADDYEC